MLSALVPGSKQSGLEPWGLLLKGPPRVFACFFFFYMLLILPEVPFIQHFSGVYTALFLDTDLLKMA